MRSFLFGVTMCMCNLAQAQAVDAYSATASYNEEGAFALRAGADLGLSERDRLQFSLGYNRSPQALADLSIYRGAVGFDHDFDAFGVALEYDYWGDADAIDSHGLQGTLYVHGKAGRLAAHYERRRTRIQFDVPLGARGFVDASRTANSDGFGVSARLNGRRVDVYANAMFYDYDVELGRLATLIDVSRVPARDRTTLIQRLNLLLFRLAQLNASSLMLANTLLEESLASGVDVRVADHTLNLEAARDRAATDDVAVESLSAGWVQPIGAAFDVEYRIGLAHDDRLGSMVYGGVTLTWYR